VHSSAVEIGQARCYGAVAVPLHTRSQGTARLPGGKRQRARLLLGAVDGDDLDSARRPQRQGQRRARAGIPQEEPGRVSIPRVALDLQGDPGYEGKRICQEVDSGVAAALSDQSHAAG
jgi:hypothetical protein